MNHLHPLLSDEPWTRISRQHAEARERVVEAVEALIVSGVTVFTVRTVAEQLRTSEGSYDPRYSMIERTITEMADARFIRLYENGDRGRPRLYATRRWLSEGHAS